MPVLFDFYRLEVFVDVNSQVDVISCDFLRLIAVLSTKYINCTNYHEKRFVQSRVIRGQKKYFNPL
jgi:hypothetical protein